MKWLFYQALCSMAAGLILIGPVTLLYWLAVACIVGPFIYSLENTEYNHNLAKTVAKQKQQRAD